MSSLMTQLADAVVTELNIGSTAGSFAVPFTAVRLTDPERELEELQTLRVDVLKGGKKCEAISRSVLQGDYRIEIVVRQKLEAQDLDPLVDALECLMEQIHQYFSLPPRRLTYFAAAVWKQSELVYPYSVQAARQKRQFTGLLRLTYQIFEKAGG